MTTEDVNPIEWITTTEAAELTGYTDARFRQLAASGAIAAKKRGRDWFLSKADVLAYTEEMKQLGTAKHDPWRTGARQRTD
jgi:excisionase family DNA binding protein